MSGPAPPHDGRPGRATTPPGYVDWSADEKAEWLWNVLITPTAHMPSALPPLRMPFSQSPWRELGIVFRRRRLQKALTRDADLMEEGRPKVIHAHGSVARIVLDPAAASPFSGLLAPTPAGGAHGLIRLSLVAKVTERTAYTPALALKLLVDGSPSADVLAMNHTVGQGRDFDLFSNSMTNDLTDEHRELRTPQRIMSVLFERVSANPRRLVSDHLAATHRDGSGADAPVAPHRLVFQPTGEARRAFVGKAGVDFRLVLADLPVGTPLYDVEGVRADGSRAPIGVIRTTSEFVSSDGGDRLFFRHVQDPADRRTDVVAPALRN